MPHGFHSSKPSRRQQPPRVTSWWRLHEESLVPQSSNHLNQALGSHTPPMDQGKLVCEGRGLSRVKYAVQMAKRAILHEMDGYLYPTLQKLVVGKILCTWRSDRSSIHSQIITIATATFKIEIWLLEVLRSDQPRWRSDHGLYRGWQSYSPLWWSDHKSCSSWQSNSPLWWSDHKGVSQPSLFSVETRFFQYVLVLQ
jgi:hypothetical protein